MRTGNEKFGWVCIVQCLRPGEEFIRNFLGHEKLFNAFNITE